MKTASDPRHKKRVKLVQSLFSLTFAGGKATYPELKKILEQKETLDGYIAQAAPERPLEKIAKIDLAILRLAVYELIIEKKQPPKVIIDEAVEIAKEYGGEGSAPFINGALGNIYAKISS